MTTLTPTTSYMTRKEFADEIIKCGVHKLEDPALCGLLSCDPNKTNQDVETIMGLLVSQPIEHDESYIRYGRSELTYNAAPIGGVCEKPAGVDCEETFDLIERGGIHIRVEKEIDCAGLQIDRALRSGTCSNAMAAGLSNRVAQNILVARNSARLRMAKIVMEDMIAAGQYQVLQSPNNFSTYTSVDSGIPRDDVSGTTPWNDPSTDILAYIRKLKCDSRCANYNEMWMNCTTWNEIYQAHKEDFHQLMSESTLNSLLSAGAGSVFTAMEGVTIRLFNGEYKEIGQTSVKWLKDGEIIFRVSGAQISHYALVNNDACAVDCDAPFFSQYGEFINNKRLDFPTKYVAQYSNYFAFLAENPSAFFFLKAY